MKQMWIGLISAATLLGANAGVAQSSKPVSIGIAAGAAIPTGTLGDSWSTGYNVTGMLGLHSYASPVGLRFEGMYNHFGGKEEAGNPSAVKIWAGTANLVYNLQGTGITPYLIGGAGYYGVDRDSPNFPSRVHRWRVTAVHSGNVRNNLLRMRKAPMLGAFLLAFRFDCYLTRRIAF